MEEGRLGEEQSTELQDEKRLTFKSLGVGMGREGRKLALCKVLFIRPEQQEVGFLTKSSDL